VGEGHGEGTRRLDERLAGTWSACWSCSIYAADSPAQAALATRRAKASTCDILENNILGMGPLQEAELAALNAVADEIRDTVEEHGYLVERAVELHPSFQDSEHPASALLRNLVREAAGRGASVSGALGQESASGSLDLIWLGGGVYRKYRLKRASVDSNGAYVFVVGDGSTMLDLDGDTFWREERWVLGYTTKIQHHIDQVFVAEVVGASDAKVRTLILGDIVPLGSAGGPRGGFMSDNEDTLPGFDDEGEVDEDPQTA
jgi:hypothetical protein